MALMQIDAAAPRPPPRPPRAERGGATRRARPAGQRARSNAGRRREETLSTAPRRHRLANRIPLQGAAQKERVVCS